MPKFVTNKPRTIVDDADDAELLSMVSEIKKSYMNKQLSSLEKKIDEGMLTSFDKLEQLLSNASKSIQSAISDTKKNNALESDLKDMLKSIASLHDEYSKTSASAKELEQILLSIQSSVDLVLIDSSRRDSIDVTSLIKPLQVQIEEMIKIITDQKKQSLTKGSTLSVQVISRDRVGRIEKVNVSFK